MWILELKRVKKANLEAKQRQNAYVQRRRGLFCLQKLRLESIFACK